MPSWVEHSIRHREAMLKKQQEIKATSDTSSNGGVSHEIEAKINGGLHPDLKNAIQLDAASSSSPVDDAMDAL